MLWWEITWFGNFDSFRIPKNPFTWPAWIFQEALVSKGHLNPSRQLNLEACRRRIERILTLIWGNSHLICTQQTGTGLNSKLNNYPKIDRSKPNACLRFLGLFSSNWAGSMRPKEMWVLQEKSRMLENANDLHLQLQSLCSFRESIEKHVLPLPLPGIFTFLTGKPPIISWLID